MSTPLDTVSDRNSDPAVGSAPVAGLGLIWAQANGGVIGRDNQIPWHLAEDMAHFRATTSGAAVIMGRRTWDSLPERFRPLPGRRNIVVSRDPEWFAEGAEGATSVTEALALAGSGGLEPGSTDSSDFGSQIWVMGGGEIYRLALPHASRLEVTELDLDVDGDTVAPTIDSGQWGASVGEWQTSASGVRYRFVRYDRVAAGVTA